MPLHKAKTIFTRAGYSFWVAIFFQWALVGCDPALQQKDSGGAGSGQETNFELGFPFGMNQPQTGADGAADEETNGTGLKKSNKPIVLKINFLIHRLEAEGEFFSEGSGVWKYLDEESIPAETARLLQLNGLRAAKGQTSTWASIRALLEANKVKTSTNSRTVNNALPLEIRIAPLAQEQTLFLYRQDRTLAGFPYRNSTSYLRVEFAIPLEEPDSVEVEVMPEIRLPRRQQKPKLTVNGWVYPEPEEPRRILRELAFEMRIKPEEFLVLGPSEQARNKHLAGGLFLCGEKQGRRVESMFVIMPQVILEGSEEK